MSMMLMAKNVRNAATMQDDPHMSKKDNLYKDISGEWDQVMVICNSILASIDLTWNEIEEELNKHYAINKHYANGWDDPGEEVSLEFLQSTEHGAI